jgi:hypothetical protein
MKPSPSRWYLFVIAATVFSAAILASSLKAAAATQTVQTCQGLAIQTAGVKLLCSRTFLATGNCSGHDELATLEGPPGSHPEKLVQPWEAFSIAVIGVQITLIEGTAQYLMAGNSYTPDVMNMLGPGEKSRANFFPARTAFRLPAMGSAGHLDLHYACVDGTIKAYLTVFYVAQ